MATLGGCFAPATGIPAVGAFFGWKVDFLLGLKESLEAVWDIDQDFIVIRRILGNFSGF